MSAGHVPQRGYAICGDGRSGSTFLAAVLASTGALGRPFELLNRARWRRDLVSDRTAFEASLASAATANGVYGVSIHGVQFDLARGIGWATRLPCLHFVSLERRDLLGQAISVARAAQTGSFKSHRPETRAPAYNERQIAQALANITYTRARWQCWFARNGIEPLRLTYEDVVSDPQEAAEKVAELIGYETPVQVDLAKIAMQVQRDELSASWRERFIAERGDRSYLDAGTMFSRGLRGKYRFARLLLGAS